MGDHDVFTRRGSRVVTRKRSACRRPSANPRPGSRNGWRAAQAAATPRDERGRLVVFQRAKVRRGEFDAARLVDGNGREGGSDTVLRRGRTPGCAGGGGQRARCPRDSQTIDHLEGGEYEDRVQARCSPPRQGRTVNGAGLTGLNGCSAQKRRHGTEAGQCSLGDPA